MDNPTAGLFITLLFIILSCTTLSSWFDPNLSHSLHYVSTVWCFDREHIAMRQSEDVDFDNLVYE